MTPGTYLRLRREAAGLTREDVALCTDSYPQVSARRRAEQLADIEADRAPVKPGEAIALHQAFRFDGTVLDQLIAIHAGDTQFYTAPAICRDCGCSRFDPCIDVKRNITCAWTSREQDWCTSCADRAVASASATAPASASALGSAAA